MALNINHPTLKEQSFNCHSASIGATPAAAYVVAPFRGRIVNLYAVTGGVITTADATISTAVNGTAITNGNFTISATGAAAGQYFEAGYGAPSGGHIVARGDRISFTPSGASAANIPATFGVTIQYGQ